MDVVAKIIEKIEGSKSIAILYHVHADGDAVGSALALCLAFSDVSRKVQVIAEEEVQSQLKFLPHAENIIFNQPINEVFDVVIAIDAGSLNRLGKRLDIYNSAKLRINIDHHKSNDILADINYVDAYASASGEMVYQIIKQNDMVIDEKIATCLYTAITTDTGSFKFSNTSSKTHRIVAELIEHGANASEISRKVYENVPFSRLKLLAKVLDDMELHYDNKVSVLYSTSDTIISKGASVDDLDNIANYGISIENVELAIFLKELAPSNTRISLRSKNYFDCSEFAKSFGGGGHVRASGCEIDLPIDKAKEMILRKVKEFGI